MIRYLKTRMEPLTLTLAKRVDEMRKFRGDRPLRARRMDYLARELEAGTFYPPYWAIAYIGPDKIPYCANGKHSSKFCVEQFEKLPPRFVCIISEWACDSVDDLPYLFARFDPYRSVRTDSETAAAHGRMHEALDDIAASHLRQVGAGIAYALLVDTDDPPLGNEERASLLHDYVDFVEWAGRFLKARLFQRTGTIAAMFATYSKSAKHADEFWRLVLEGRGDKLKSGNRQYHKFLGELVLTASRQSPNGMWKPRAIFVKGIHAWNAWREGHDTDLKYRPSAPIPKVR